MKARLTGVYVVLCVVFPLFLLVLKLAACESDHVDPIPVHDERPMYVTDDEYPAPDPDADFGEVARPPDGQGSGTAGEPVAEELPALEVPDNMFGEEPPDEPAVDEDGDGWSELLDCNDANARVYPLAPEVCGDGVDQDCDGEDDVCPEPEVVEEELDDDPPSAYEPLDEEETTEVHVDVDLDGYSDLLDCDDEDPTVHPGAEDVCANARDEDCDGEDSECGMPVPVFTVTWQTPFAMDARRITLSGEYTFADGSYGFTWREIITREHESDVTYSLPFVGPGDRFRFSVEYVDLWGATSWSCIGPYPPGTLQGRASAQVDGLPIEVATNGDPSGETTGCGLNVLIP